MHVTKPRATEMSQELKGQLSQSTVLMEALLTSSIYTKTLTQWEAAGAMKWRKEENLLFISCLFIDQGAEFVTQQTRLLSCSDASHLGPSLLHTGLGLTLGTTVWSAHAIVYLHGRVHTRLSTHLAEDDLRRQVLWGSTQSPGPALHPFCESKICYLQKKETTLRTEREKNPHIIICDDWEYKALPGCNPADRWAGSPAWDLGRWGPESEGIQMSVQSGLRRSGRVVHCGQGSADMQLVK